MKVRDAIAGFGIDADQVPGELCIVQFTPKGARHFPYTKVADREIVKDTYIATGTYAAGSIQEYGGRKAENVTSVLWLVLDCDLKDYLGISVEELRTWTDTELMNACRAMAGDVRELLELLGVKPNRVDYTGYGICVYIVLCNNTSDDLQTIRDLNAGLVDQVNSTWGSTLADPGVHDAGTRVTRLVPGPNTKGPQPRPAQTIWREDGRSSIEDLQKVITARTRTTVARAIPRTGSVLPDDVSHNIIDAVLPHWKEGNRHGLALALAGILAKAGASEDDARTIVEFAANSAGDLELEDRLKAVATSYTRARNGIQTRGLFGLRDWLPKDTAEYIDRELDKVRIANATVTATAREMPTPKDAPPLVSVPGLYTLPIPDIARQGFIDEYINLMRPTTEASEGYHLGVALTIFGAMIGRSAYANFGKRLHANLFTLLVGDSGKSRKDTAIGCGITLLRTTYETMPAVAVTGGKASMVLVGSGVKVATDIASAEGLISTLKNDSNVLMYLSEFARLMGNANRQGTRTIAPTLMEAFDTPDTLSNLAKLNPVEAKEPYLSILAATQPMILESLMSEGDIHSGFINRWMIIPGASDAPNYWPPAIDQQWRETLFENITATIGINQKPRAINGTDDAKAFWKDWYEAHWHQERSDEENSMAVRHPVMAIKIALIYTVINGDPIIERHHLETGVAIVEWMAAQVAPLLPSWGASPMAKLEQKILKTVRDHGPLQKREITGRVSNPRRWTAPDIKRTVDALLDNGVLVLTAPGMIGIAR